VDFCYQLVRQKDILNWPSALTGFALAAIKTASLSSQLDTVRVADPNRRGGWLTLTRTSTVLT